MWNRPTKKQLDNIPRLYDQENVKDKIVHMHFFIGACDWYIIEYDGEETFFGYANLGDNEMAEWGYISYRDLKEINIPPGFKVDRETSWKPTPASKVEKINE